MITVEYPYAGLILPDASDLDPGPYLDAAETALSRLDPRGEGRPPLRSDRRGQVIGATLGVIVIPEEDSDYGPRVILEVIAADGSVPEDEAAARLLSDTVLLALVTSDADILEWYSPDVLIDREDFIRLRSYVSPRRSEADTADQEHACADMPLPSEEDTLSPQLRAMLMADDEGRPATTDRLAAYRIRLEQKPPAEQRVKSAGWLLAGAVGVFSAPIAVFLFLISLYRGMDVRLVSQAAAVTALFVVLYNTDRLQLVLSHLTH